MRKFSIFTIGIITLFAVAVAMPKQAQAGSDGRVIAGMVLMGIGAALAYSSQRRNYRHPPAYYGRPMPRPAMHPCAARGFHPRSRACQYLIYTMRAGHGRSLQYNPYTANRHYLDSRPRRRCSPRYDVDRRGSIDHLVEQGCR